MAKPVKRRTVTGSWQHALRGFLETLVKISREVSRKTRGVNAHAVSWKRCG